MWVIYPKGLVIGKFFDEAQEHVYNDNVNDKGNVNVKENVIVNVNLNNFNDVFNVNINDNINL